MRQRALFTVLGLVTSLVLLGGTALATNANFILGSTTANKPDALTAVTAQNKDGHGGLNGPMIKLANPSTGSNATALGLTVGAGRPPLATNSAVKVGNLNADLLDGLDSTAFLKGPGQLLAAKTQFLQDGGVWQLFLDQSTGKPAFRLGYDCPDDLSNAGEVVLFNMSTTVAADMVAVGNGLRSALHSAGGGDEVVLGAPAAGSYVSFHAGWADGHMATIWVFSFHRTGSPDPRDDGCYVQATAVTR